MGKSKARRLKRYLGLRRSHGISIQGGIDRLLPSKLMGWVSAIDPDISLFEVRLLVGPHLISRAEINQPRIDVCEKLGLEGAPGFVLPLPVDLPPLDWDLPVRAIALSSDGNTQVELSLMQKKVNTEERLRAVLQSEQRGVVGHVDGIQNGALVGWAGRPGQSNPLKIWLQAEGLDPIALICCHWRKDISALQIPRECGFALEFDSLPECWAEQRIWCSFDQAGQWHIPQEQVFFAPSVVRRAELNLPHQGSDSVEVSAITYADQIASAPENLQEHWRSLEEFRLFLDDFEYELNRRDVIRERQAQVKPQRMGWFGRLFKPAR